MEPARFSISIDVNTLTPAGLAGLSQLLRSFGDRPDREGVVPTLAPPRRTQRRIPEEQTTPEGFRASLTEQGQRFLNRLEQNGSLTAPQAVAMFGFINPKALGGLVGAMQRKAANRGLVLPFRATENKLGDRMWVWTGSSALRPETP